MSYLGILKKAEGQGYGPGRPSPENAKRGIEERNAEARLLLNELDRAYNMAFFELCIRGIAEDEGRKRAMQETTSSEVYRRWRALR